MIKNKTILLLSIILLLITINSCSFLDKKTSLENTLVDVSDREDLIASGKIKPAPEYVTINGKKIRTSPEKYRSENECEKAEELLMYRKRLRGHYDYTIRYEYENNNPTSLYQNFIMRDADGTVRIIGCFADWCSGKTIGNNNYVLLKDKNVYKNSFAKHKLIKYYKNYKNFSEQKYVFLKTKNCIVTFYKGKKF